MKINEVIISEQPVAGTQQPANVTKSGTGASGFPVNQPAGQAPQVKTAPLKKAPLKKAPVKKKAAPAANPNQAAAADPSLDPYDPAKDTNVTQVAASDGTTADLDRLKQLAVGGQQPAAQAAQAAPAPAEPAAGQRPGGIAFNQDAGATSGQAAQPAAGQRPGGIAFNQDAGATSGQAAQPAAPAPEAQPAAPAAPAAPSTVAPVVKTGSGGTLTTRDGKPVTSRSDDEIAWAQKNPYQPYPGPGWQEKQKAQGDANAAAVKGFLNKINPFAKKTAPAAPGTPAAGAAFNQGAPVTMESGELNDIRRLSGLK